MLDLLTFTKFTFDIKLYSRETFASVRMQESIQPLGYRSKLSIRRVGQLLMCCPITCRGVF